MKLMRDGALRVERFADKKGMAYIPRHCAIPSCTRSGLNALSIIGHPLGSMCAIHTATLTTAWDSALGIETAPIAAPRSPKTHCRHGHEYTEANTRINSQGRRVCVECVNARQRRQRERVAA